MLSAHYYYYMIRPFIPLSERPICSQRDRHYIGNQNKSLMRNNSYIYLHCGSPCYRYCICKYFPLCHILESYKEYNYNNM